MEYINFNYQQDQRKLAQSFRKAGASVISANNDILGRDISPTTKQVLFAQNTLFWIGIACLEAPHHI
jgi:hypothetical protein